MTDYKKISRNIRIIYAAIMAAVATMVVLSESNVLPMEGLLLGMSPDAKYIVEVAMLFTVGLGILAALKGFNWCLIHKVHAAEGDRKAFLYVALSNARVCLLGSLMILGLVFYYGLLENWGIYYTLAALVASLFCLPSAEGVKIELESKPQS